MVLILYKPFSYADVHMFEVLMQAAGISSSVINANVSMHEHDTERPIIGL